MKKLALLLCLVASPALADFAPPITDPLTKAACGECHMAFQPAFLPARSWDKMMANLADHFGDNATLAPDKAAHIRKVLAESAADGPQGGRMGHKILSRLRADETPLRITETAAFLRKHRLPESEWKRPDVVTKSNCVACHKTAEKGIYEDD
ncbi:cytochrome C [Paramagnetospirillum marisnigri]|uniref:Cytochrome C n=2 Tax=Paramagnetospirillum marisnigri TaxID=1285242 RepID=A0A178MT11_9PROT|nr:cytochrome C [Paramagnetospirillum marisnigri]